MSDGSPDAASLDPALTPHARAAFEALFRQTHMPLLAYAVRRVAYPEDAADIVADAFVVAWRRIEEVPDGPDARPWMFGVARGCLANYYRGERRRTALAERLRQSLENAHLHRAPESDDVPDVRQALMSLSGADRELVQLAAWEELSRAEIALVLGCSQATVRVRLHRARARLRKALSGPDEPPQVPSPPRPRADRGLEPPPKRSRTSIPLTPSSQEKSCAQS